MEESRYKSRVTIHDGVFDKIQQQRYDKHIKSLERLKHLQGKSNSEYKLKQNFVPQLQKSKKAQKQANAIIFPPDTQFKNCIRKVKQIKRGSLKLPKISNIRLYQNKSCKIDQEKRVAHQNKILTEKIEHISLDKQNKRKQLSKFIKEYELYKKISSRSLLKIKSKQMR